MRKNSSFLFLAEKLFGKPESFFVCTISHGGTNTEFLLRKALDVLF
jgi:hypothetical protein